jgi:hypothetical protein
MAFMHIYVIEIAAGRASALELAKLSEIGHGRFSPS